MQRESLGGGQREIAVLIPVQDEMTEMGQRRHNMDAGRVTLPPKERRSALGGDGGR